MVVYRNAEETKRLFVKEHDVKALSSDMLALIGKMYWVLAAGAWIVLRNGHIIHFRESFASAAENAHRYSFNEFPGQRQNGELLSHND